MKAEIEALYTDDFLEEVIKKFALDTEKTKVYDSFENFIFESEWQGKPASESRKESKVPK
ncbi:MAG: hypothetical protein GNW80_13970 [Asgard group archaeon]|nr:hypothetical protein [Asgard group archaeon]